MASLQKVCSIPDVTCALCFMEEGKLICKHPRGLNEEGICPVPERARLNNSIKPPFGEYKVSTINVLTEIAADLKKLNEAVVDLVAKINLIE